MNTFFLSLVFTAISSAFLIVRFASTNEAIAYSAHKEQKVEDKSAQYDVATFDVKNYFMQDISYREESIEKVIYTNEHQSKIKSIYPQIVLHKSSTTFDSDFHFNQQVNDTLQLLENTFLEFEISLNQNNNEKSFEEGICDYIGELSTHYTMLFVSKNYISIAIHTRTYHGGAHGMYGTTTLNYDRVTQKLITLGDICTGNYLEKISEHARLQLKQLFIEQNNMEDLDSWALQGTLPQEDLYTIWALTPYGLSIIFPVYQVAAYCFGEQQIIIPYHDLDDIFISDFLSNK